MPEIPPNASTSVAASFPNQDVDWDTPFRHVPDSKVGEFSAPGANPVVADLNALSFTETARTPYDGFTDRSQAKFPTNDAPDQKGR